MNAISRIMEIWIQGKKGRNNGRGDTVQRKVNCSLTADGRKLYKKLFPEYPDTTNVLIARLRATVPYRIA